MQRRVGYVGFAFLLGLLLSCAISVMVSNPRVLAEQPHKSMLLVTGNQTVTENDKASRQEFQNTFVQASEEFKGGSYEEAIALWSQALALTLSAEEQAHVNKSLGFAYYRLGKVNKAIQHWELAAQVYQAKKDSESESSLAEILVAQAQAYVSLGQFRQATPLLERAVSIAKDKHPRIEAEAQGVLGNSYLVSGDYDQAIKAYQSSLQLATASKNPAYVAAALNSLVNVFSRRSLEYLNQRQTAQFEDNEQEQERLSDLSDRDRASAFAAATRAVNEKSGGLTEARALVNMIGLLQQSPHSGQNAISAYQQQAIAILEHVPDSRSKAYVLIDLANKLPAELKIRNLTWAINIAKNIDDNRTQSFALGELGHVYELQGQLSEAMNFTRQAQNTAQQVNAQDSLYRWQRQAGRIYKAEGLTPEAMTAYRQAITTLQGIRGDIVAASKDLQFDVRDQVEPVYRELMTLLLDNGKDNIKEALQISDLLKLTELQSFFGDDCLEVKRVISPRQENVAKTSQAVVNSIILDQKTYMVLRSPDGSLKSYLVSLTSEQLKSKIKQFRLLLEDIGTVDYLTEAQQLYNLLIRPMAEDLARIKPSVLVFINDGVLRNVPMAALHDGEQFLVQKYSIATTLGFNLTDDDKLSRNREASIFGLTVQIPPFAALPNVGVETRSVQELVGGRKFLDEDFTISNLEKQVQQNYPTIHIATHGQFGGTPKSTFLQAFDTKIFLKDFEKILQMRKQPLDLLTLSACQTASGDNRAVLGLAGLALRTGVKNVLATLWFINDRKTVPLITDFYSELQQRNITEAEALRNAQLKLIAKHDHPGNWSSFVLIED